MIKRLLSVSILGIVLSGTIFAQTPQPPTTKSTHPVQRKTERMSNTPLTPEQLKERQEKMSQAVAKKLELTEDQTKKFTPVFENYQKQKMELFKANAEAVKGFKSKDSKSEADYKKMVILLTDTKAKEASLQKQYSNSLSTFLPAEKVYRALKISSGPSKNQKSGQNKSGQYGNSYKKGNNKEKGQKFEKNMKSKKSDVKSKIDDAQRTVDQLKK